MHKALAGACLVFSGAAYAVTPGAYSFVERELQPGTDEKTTLRCVSAEQVDANGYLVPQKTLATHPSCQISEDKTSGQARSWTAVCAGGAQYKVTQKNSGKDFELDVKMELSGTEIHTHFKGEALGRACTAGGAASGLTWPVLRSALTRGAMRA